MIREKQVTLYVADDGSEFDSREMAERYERTATLAAELTQADHDVMSTFELAEWLLDNYEITRRK